MSEIIEDIENLKEDSLLNDKEKNIEALYIFKKISRHNIVKLSYINKNKEVYDVS